MPDDVTLRPLGRVSEPSYTVAPKGSLLRAVNCVLRKPGILEPIGAPIRLTDTNGPANKGAWQISPQFDNGTVPEQLCHVSQGLASQSGVRKSSAMGTEIQYVDADGSSASIEYFDHGDGLTMYPMHIARDNLYVCDQRGVYKWCSTDNSALEYVWDASRGEMSPSLNGSGTTWLANGDHVAYMFVVLYEDSNGVIRRSAPKARSEITNSDGAARRVIAYTGIKAADYDHPSFKSVELYRTRAFASSVALPNEYYLVEEIPKADFAANGSAYMATYYDEIDSTNLLSGGPLYTNGNADAAYVAPPEHLYHAHWNGYEFWANVAEKEFFPEIKSTATFASMTRSTTGDISVGSPTVSNVVSVTGMEVGMLISGTLGTFPYGAYITAISGAGPYSITMSENSANTATGTTVTARDTFFVRWGDGSTDRIAFTNNIGGMSSCDDSWLDVSGETGTEYTDESKYAFTWTISSKHRPSRQGVAQAWVSNPENFEGLDWADLNTGTGAPTTGGTEALPSLHKRRIYWSEHQKPDVTTLLSFQDVQGDIAGLAATRDALIILTEAVAYRLTGNESPFRIDSIQNGARIIGGRSTQVLNDVVYTLGDRGILRITAGSYDDTLCKNVVSDWFSVDDDWDGARIEYVRRYMLRNGGYHPPALCAAADPTHNEYALLCSGSDSVLGDGVPVDVLVYNADTSAFVTWELHESLAYPVSCLSYARGDYGSTSSPQEPGIVFARQVSAGDTSAALFLMDNSRDNYSLPSTYLQTVTWRAMFSGDPASIKQFVYLIWNIDVEDSAASTVVATYGDESDPDQDTQTVGSSVAKNAIRLVPPRGFSRHEKPVFGLTGYALKVLGMKAKVRMAGDRAPL